MTERPAARTVGPAGLDEKAVRPDALTGEPVCTEAGRSGRLLPSNEIRLAAAGAGTLLPMTGDPLTETVHELARDDARRAVKPPQSRWKDLLGRAAFESALIVFSVLLALSLDSWRDDRRQHARLLEARASLADEIALNRAEIAADDHLPYHRRYRDHYRTLVESKATTGAGAIFDGGIHPARLRDTAWQSVTGSDVANLLPFGQRSQLVGIYQDQANLDGLFRSILAGLVTPRSDRESAAYLRDQSLVLFLTLTDMVVIEERLLRDYEKAEAELRSATR